MNPELKIRADQNRVGPESEHIYTGEFHESLDGTCNALDNVEARLYNNSQCVFFRKPLLESGTMGPMAHFETIIPDLTESYESHKDPPTQGIPQCTLHSFPSNITHCAMWAREQFFNLFTRAPGIANQYLTDQSYVRKMMKADRGGLYENLLLIEKILVTERPQTFQDCIVWARLRFEDLFNFVIRNLVFSYPPDWNKTATGSGRAPGAFQLRWRMTQRTSSMWHSFISLPSDIVLRTDRAVVALKVKRWRSSETRIRCIVFFKSLHHSFYEKVSLLTPS
jgi:ubiquitin-activating enzyme E1